MSCSAYFALNSLLLPSKDNQLFVQKNSLKGWSLNFFKMANIPHSGR